MKAPEIGTRVSDNRSHRKGIKGTVVRESHRSDCVTVEWDGMKTPTRIHIDFLNIIRLDSTNEAGGKQ